MDKIMNSTHKAANRNEPRVEKKTSSGKSAEEKSVDKDPKDFATELSKAGIGAQAQAQTQAQAQSVIAQPVSPEVTPKVPGAKTSELEALAEKGKLSQLSSSIVERSPVSQISAASMNTGAAVAGLKPWSRDWVMAGGIEGNPNVNPLIHTGEDKGVSPEGSADPKVLEGLRKAWQEMQSGAQKTRGDAAEAPLDAAALNALMLAEKANPKNVKGAESVSSGLEPKEEAHLMSLLSELKGQMEMGETNSNMNQVQSAFGKPIATQRAPGNQNLSGAEFLSTLGAVQGMQGKAGQQLGNESGDNLSGRQGSPQTSQSGNTLRLVDGAKSKKTQFGDDLTAARLGTQAHAPQLEAVAIPAKELTGHVVQGAGAQDRLSSETLLGVSNGIKNFSATGGGEMRIRLNPNNLGELHVRVVTNGGNVGLQIQASDEKARKVIEESVSHLKESLASQNLNLSKLEVTIANAGTAMGNENQRQDQQNSGQNQTAWSGFNDMLGQNQTGQSNQGKSQQWDSVDLDANPSRVATPLRSPLGSANLAAGSPGRTTGTERRLDVTA